MSMAMELYMQAYAGGSDRKVTSNEQDQVEGVTWLMRTLLKNFRQNPRLSKPLVVVKFPLTMKFIFLN